MKDGGSADRGSLPVKTSNVNLVRRSRLRRIGLAILAIFWVAWFVVGLVVWLAGSMALGDHHSASSAMWLLLIIWTVPLGVIGAIIIWFAPRSAPE